MAIDLIPAGINVDERHPDVAAYANATSTDLRERWVSERGLGLVQSWEAQGLDRDFLEKNVGRFFGKIDLRGIELVGKCLSRKDLSNCDLYAALLSRVKLIQSNLDSCYFSEADIRGADLSWSSARDAFFDNVVYDQGTKLLGVALQSVNFNLAALLYDQARTEQRIAHLERRSPFFAFFLKWSCDYGRSIRRWMLWTVVAVSLFSAFFYMIGESFRGIHSFGDAIYFSIVTFTTLGYGDIVPVTGIARTLTILDVATGFVMSGLLISILAKKIFGD